VKRGALLLAAGLCRAALGFGFDFGLLLDQRVEAAQEYASYSVAADPWLSAGISENLQFHASAKLAVKYTEDGRAEPFPLVELSRLELDCRPAPRTLLKAGRFGFSDSSGLIAAGTFDGLRGELQTSLGSLSAGAWYTGLLFKESANITMTGGDLSDYHAPWDGPGAYFAPRRLLGDLRWDIPGILGPLNLLSLEGLAQFDLGDHEDALHSQYLEVRYEFFPAPGLQIAAAALAEALEDGDGGGGMAFALSAEAGLRLPGRINQRLVLGADFSSGNWNNTVAAFVPLSGNSTGFVFAPKMSSLARLCLGYKARLHETLSLDAGARCFMRTDRESGEFAGANPVEGAGLFYGAEAYASAIWAPLDDIMATLGCGAFFPGLGNVFDSRLSWKLTAGLVLSL
jgi:hypothetical protein